eukprot:CAMPEP_0197431312 /NCGR_PEP_ID=MMETSP1170-20131217/53116_1 /TAXON_ID=54406 /ORGANISM="Sarcinochrysis sp, Strain CCMP770" /LENGTH=222 /DNA_ID=CAMNT_0042959257 /DNA_START=84 /DNA_END=750 /DNA_ORIENTATION=+
MSPQNLILVRRRLFEDDWRLGLLVDVLPRDRWMPVKVLSAELGFEVSKFLKTPGIFEKKLEPFGIHVQRHVDTRLLCYAGPGVSSPVNRGIKITDIIGTEADLVRDDGEKTGVSSPVNRGMKITDIIGTEADLVRDDDEKNRRRQDLGLDATSEVRRPDAVAEPDVVRDDDEGRDLGVDANAGHEFANTDRKRAAVGCASRPAPAKQAFERTPRKDIEDRPT